MKDKKFDLEGQLRASRSLPRAEFADALAGEVRSTGARRSPRGRVGLALALSGLIVVALASFGGIGYASSSASHAVKKASKPQVHQVTKSAAHAQYAPYTPPTKPAAKPTTQTQGTTATGGTESAQGTLATPKAKSAQLPFTGLSLWVPLAIGLMLISLGLVLRTRGKRRDTAQ
jgi:hypothetical protein